jgi:hypothetical protein
LSWCLKLDAYRYGPTHSASPTVYLTALASNATASGSSVTVSANNSHNVGVLGVQFKQDGANLGANASSGATVNLAGNTVPISSIKPPARVLRSSGWAIFTNIRERPERQLV